MLNPISEKSNTISVFITSGFSGVAINSFSPLKVPVPVLFDSKKNKSSVFTFSSPASGAIAERVANPLVGS